MLYRMIRQIKVSSDWFWCVLSFLSTSRRWPQNLPTQLTNVYLSATSTSYAIDDIGGGAREVISSMYGLGPDIFSTFWMGGQVLHRARVHLKVTAWSLVCGEPLTKKPSTLVRDTPRLLLSILRNQHLIRRKPPTKLQSLIPETHVHGGLTSLQHTWSWSWW